LPRNKITDDLNALTAGFIPALLSCSIERPTTLVGRGLMSAQHHPRLYFRRLVVPKDFLCPGCELELWIEDFTRIGFCWFASLTLHPEVSEANSLRALIR
jgi:hypothetical protein